MKNDGVLIVITLLICIGMTVQVQNTIPAISRKATGTGSIVSYSVGQVGYNSNSGITGTVAIGVRQPFVIFITTAVINSEEITSEYSVYPDSTINHLYLKVCNHDPKNQSYRLYDISGLIPEKKILSNEIQIPMGNRSSGTNIL